MGRAREKGRITTPSLKLGRGMSHSWQLTGRTLKPHKCQRVPRGLMGTQSTELFFTELPSRRWRLAGGGGLSTNKYMSEHHKPVKLRPECLMVCPFSLMHARYTQNKTQTTHSSQKGTYQEMAPNNEPKLTPDARLESETLHVYSATSTDMGSNSCHHDCVLGI